MSYGDLEIRVRALEEQARQMVRVGVVSSVDYDRGTARVVIKDDDGVITYDLPVLVGATVRDKVWSMPDMDEQVLCCFLPTGHEVGFILGSFYSQGEDGDEPAEGAGEDKRSLVFHDGTVLEYDRHGHALTVKIAHEGRIITAGTIEHKGDLKVEGDITATGSIIDSGGNTNHHSH